MTDLLTKGGNATSRAVIPQPLKWHIDGGKAYLANRIIALMPKDHVHYVEPFFGGGSVMLAKEPEGVSEVANDLNGWLTNFWEVLRSSELFPQLQRFLEASPCAEAMFTEARCVVESSPIPDGFDPVTAAAWFFVLNRQSMAARMECFTPLSRTRTRRGMNELPSAWLTAIEGLPIVHARLKRVVILSRSAIDVIRQQDGEKTLFYLDPPYLKETRTAPDVYLHEMTREQHEELLKVLANIEGKFILSGYDSDLYRAYERDAGWKRVEIEISNHSASGETKRRMTEVLWMNYEPK